MVSKNTSEIDFSLVLDTIHDGISIMDSSGIVVRINKNMSRITGLPPEVFVDQHILSLYEKGYFQEIPFALRALREASTQHGIQHQSNGKIIMISATPIFDDNNNVQYVVSDLRDVTEMENLKAELEKTKQITELYRSEFVRLSMESLLEKKIVVRSKEMLDLMKSAIKVASSGVTVLISGESGVGKGVVATVIHQASLREGPFLTLNCNTIPDSLFESELFGYEKGSFTGASNQGKLGLLDLANDGTLFLDEIGDLPINVQGKFLHFLETGEFRRIGGTQHVAVDLRIIAATNKDLSKLVKGGNFRMDLYYRLRVVPIEVPPLRKRRSDIAALLGMYLDKFNRKYNSHKHLSLDAINILQDYHWPGNIRELANLVERLVITSPHDIIAPKDLPDMDSDVAKDEKGDRYQLDLKEAVAQAEREIFEQALERYHSSRKIASVLKISHTTVLNKLRKLGIAD